MKKVWLLGVVIVAAEAVTAIEAGKDELQRQGNSG